MLTKRGRIGIHLDAIVLELIMYFADSCGSEVVHIILMCYKKHTIMFVLRLNLFAQFRRPKVGFI